MEIVLKTKKRDIPFKFGLGFLGEAIEETGLETTELLSKLGKNPFKYIPILMYHSAKYYAFRHKVDFNESLDDFIDIIDDEGGMESGLFTEFMTAFNKSMTKDVPTAVTTPQKSIESKKK